MSNSISDRDIVTDYYDNFYRKLLHDYVYGNRRLESALRFTLQWIEPHSSLIIDIGRGIGWSSWEICRHNPHVTIRSVDISPRLTEVAIALFPTNAIQFITGDVTEFGAVESEKYDAAILLDVYEHIPAERRCHLHSFLDRSLTSSGSVILTFPSIYHQNNLRNHNPGGLQPIDEDITKNEVASFAKDIHGDVVHYQEVSIWSNSDYVHAVISRRSIINNRPFNNTIALERKADRDDRVQKALGVHVLPVGSLVSRVAGPGICVVAPSMGAYSETFIRSHIERIPSDVHVLYGGHLPTLADDNYALISHFSLARRVLFRMQRKMRRLPRDYNVMLSESIKYFLKSNRIQAVLAEYGPTGAMMSEICSSLGIPLVIHFHGYDAYNEDTVSEFGNGYAEMFDYAQAIIAVSADMRRQLASIGAPEHKILVNSCGVDPNGFVGANPSAADLVFVAVGRFVDKKAPDLTLRAFNKVLNEIPEARLIMIGDGYLLDACKRYVTQSGMSESVEFKGVLPHEQVAELMRSARVFVQHSIRAGNGDSEGTPVAILEASASGLPIISTRHTGIKDAVMEGSTGFLVDEGDVDGMAEYMISLAKDPELAAHMGQAGRKHIEEDYSMDKSIDRLWNIIVSAIKDGA